MDMPQSASPKVSVIIPVWNPGLGICRCIDSLRDQTLDDIEMIFVDDCGTDGAMDIVREAAAEDPRIRIITNAENMGPGVSRNAGIEAARGAYLSFVDADDYVNACFLERLYAKAIAGQLDIVKGRICYVKEDVTQVNRPELNDEIRKGVQLGKPLFCLFHYQHQSALYRRAWLLKQGICYGTSRRAEDVTFLLRACHQAERFDFEESAEYHYCQRSDSLIHDMHLYTLERKLHAFQEQMDYIVEYMEDEQDASLFVADRVHYDLRLCNYLRRKPESREAANRFTTGLREQVLRFPHLEKLKNESFIVSVLCDYGVGLARQPFNMPWEGLKVERSVETIREWIDFVKEHPKCSKAAEQDLRRLYRVAESMCHSDNSHLPPSLVRDVKRIFRKNAMKRTIRAFIAKFPLSEPLCRAAKRWRSR